MLSMDSSAIGWDGKFTFQIFFIGMALGLASFGFLPSRAWFAAKGESRFFQPYFSEPRPRSSLATFPAMDLFSLSSSRPE